MTPIPVNKPGAQRFTRFTIGDTYYGLEDSGRLHLVTGEPWESIQKLVTVLRWVTGYRPATLTVASVERETGTIRFEESKCTSK